MILYFQFSLARLIYISLSKKVGGIYFLSLGLKGLKFLCCPSVISSSRFFASRALNSTESQDTFPHLMPKKHTLTVKKPSRVHLSISSFIPKSLFNPLGRLLHSLNTIRLLSSARFVMCLAVGWSFTNSVLLSAARSIECRFNSNIPARGTWNENYVQRQRNPWKETNKHRGETRNFALCEEFAVLTETQRKRDTRQN